MADDEVSIRIRARGGRQSAREVSLAERAIVGLGRSASNTGTRVEGLVSRSASRSLMSLRYQAYGAGLTIGGLGALAVKSGIQFNASMEQNQIAFEQFLGSSKAARAELGTLYQLAKATPFEFPQLTQAARKFLAFGFNVKQANSLLKTVGDAAAGAGLGADAIDRIVLALGQIRSKGRLQAEELLQLQELGVLDTSKLRGHLGMTADQMANIGNQGVSANKAIRAIQATLNDTFAGQSARQAQSFNGQISTLRDNLNQTMGTLSRPIFNRLKRDVLPALNSTAQRVNEIFSRKDLSLEQKLTLSRGAARHRLEPLVRALGDEIGRMDLGDKLGNAFETAAPKMADAAGRAAPRVASAFVNAWWHAGPWGKLFTAGLLLKRVGAFSTAGDLAARAFLRRYVPTVVAGEAAANAAGAAGGGAGALSRLGKIAPWLLTAARYGGPAGGFLLGSGLAGGPFGSNAGLSGSAERRRIAQMRGQGGPAVPVRLPNGVTVFESPASARIDPNLRHGGRARGPRARSSGSRLELHTHVELNRRELGKAVDDIQLDEAARGRRPR